MTNDDLKKLQECKTELFEGIGQVLADIGLEHLKVAGLELEPSSVWISGDQPTFEKGGLEAFTEESDCEKKGARWCGG